MSHTLTILSLPPVASHPLRKSGPKLSLRRQISINIPPSFTCRQGASHSRRPDQYEQWTSARSGPDAWCPTAEHFHSQRKQQRWNNPSYWTVHLSHSRTGLEGKRGKEKGQQRDVFLLIQWSHWPPTVKGPNGWLLSPENVLTDSFLRRSKHFMNPSCEPLSSMWTSVGWKHTLLTVRLCSVNSWSCLFLEGFPRFQVTTAPLVAAVASRFSSIWCHITSAQLKLRDGLRPTRRFSFSTNCSSSNVYILKILRPATTTCVASRHTLIALAGASKWQNIVRPLMVLLLLPRAVVTLDIFSIFLMQKNMKFTEIR